MKAVHMLLVVLFFTQFASAQNAVGSQSGSTSTSTGSTSTTGSGGAGGGSGSNGGPGNEQLDSAPF